MSLEYRIGDVFERLAEIPDESIDLIVTSPPFLALRSYLPADHPDKHKEIGSEATPADFLDTLLALTAEFGRVLAPHGSICVELGDTYAGDDRRRTETVDAKVAHRINGRAGSTRANVGRGWPLAKSLTGIPTLYPWSLAYNRNLLTGQESPAGPWRIRNIIVWARPNPPVGALGDKFRPATSYITVACRGPRRYFDLDAVRGPGSPNTHARLAQGVDSRPVNGKKADNPNNNFGSMDEIETAGAPPLDWHTDQHPEDGDWLWKLATAPYKGAHYATYPLELPTRLIMAMCPLRVCVECGKPSERITREVNYAPERLALAAHLRQRRDDMGLTVTDVARYFPSRTGGMTGCVSNWEQGFNVPTAEQWPILKSVLGLSNEFDGVVSSERRWTEDPATYIDGNGEATNKTTWSSGILDGKGAHSLKTSASTRQGATLGFTDCQHDNWRTGRVLDPFGGSGTTAAAAQNVGRHAILIDLDERNAELARQRVGMFLEIVA